LVVAEVEAMNEESLFAAALEKSAGTERQAFLDQACGGDTALRERVERLLAADQRDRGILERGPDPAAMDTGGADPALLPDRLFAGRFKLRQKLGEGGMGEVWVADQIEPVQRRVALKVIRPGLDSARMLARFDQERQALAVMDHPNIAKVFDAGTTGARGQGPGVREEQEANRAGAQDAQHRPTPLLTPDPSPLTPTSRPYFVMELITGAPITQYCDEAKLSPKERLELFIPVCKAVQHAHQKGIIHRDLKPSNVLVATFDGKPVPKVIDFGVAKAVGPRLTGQSVYTEVGTLVGTLEYMSPEQAELNNLDIDTRTDIYALGVMLYELLTGSVPFARKELQAAAFTEMLRIIKEVDPVKPSTKLSSSETLPSVAAVRHMEPQKLIALVRGELDWIVMKALEKDRSRRYETANGLAMDVQRYLADEPVVAGPPSAGYRLSKFIGRNRKAVLAAAAIFLLLVGGIAGTTTGLLAARAQRDQARDNLELANTNFELARKAVDECYGVATKEPLLQEESMRKVRKLLLEKALPFYEGFQAQRRGDAEIEAELAANYHRLGYITAEIGRKTAAIEACEQARMLREKLVAEHPGVAQYQMDLAETCLHLGQVQLRAGQQDAAANSYERTRSIAEKLVASHPDVPEYQIILAKSYISLGQLQYEASQAASAAKSFDQCRLILEKLVAAHPDIPERQSLLARCYQCLGVLQSDTAERTAAAKSLDRARQIQEKLASAYPEVSSYRTVLARTYYSLGILQTDLGQMAAAAKSFEQARQIQDKLAAAHPEVIGYSTSLAYTVLLIALLQRDTGQTEVALRTFDQGLALLTPLAGKHPDDQVIRSHIADLRSSRAVALAYSGQHDQAAAEAAEVARQEHLSGQNLYNVAGAFSASAGAVLKDDKLPKSERTKRSEHYAGQAVEFLIRSQSAGFLGMRANLENMKKDKEIDPLRARADYKKLLTNLESRISSPEK
jgi:serine/threonine protein kinase/tetratricopeptide (TPR) repeat protein